MIYRITSDEQPEFYEQIQYTGCTDPFATNFSGIPTTDDGSCLYNFQSSPQTLPYINLFFSEYAEGSGNNKYLEIYNPSSSSVDLNAYALLCVSTHPLM